MRRLTSLRLAAASVSIAALAIATAPVLAQAPGTTQQEEDVETETVSGDPTLPVGEQTEPTGAIVVTGSRIARPEYEFANPIQSFTAETIIQSGDTNLTDFLVDTPALVGSDTGEANAGSNAGFQSAGLNNLNLRNLGVNRTLVLVDGRRHVASTPGSAAVDVNTIPTELVARVDVLTGGASAVYGADGVSGVVNFVMKRDFEGIVARGQSGISRYGDGGNLFGSIVAGENFADDRANIAVAYEYSRSDRVNDKDRPFTGDPLRRFELLQDPDEFRSLDDPNVPDRRLFNDIRWSDSSPGGAVDTDFDFLPEFTGEGGIYDRGTPLPGTGGRTVGGSGTPTAGYFGDFLPFLEKHNVNALASFQVSPAARIYAEGKYVDTTAFTVSQPTFDFFTFLSAENPFLPEVIRNAIVPGAAGDFGLPDGVFISRDNLDFGIRGDTSERETLRGVLGIDGRLSDHLSYDVSYVYGQVKNRTTSTNDRVEDRYWAALDAVVDPDTGQITCRINIDGSGVINPENFGGAPVTFTPGQCVPLNILGNGSPSRAALDFISQDHVTNSKITQEVVSGALSGDLGFLFELPGGPIAFALGAEYRKETSRSTPSDLLQEGLLLDSAEIAPSFGEFDVKEVFGELNVPILKDQPFAELLSVGGAVRFSDYSTVGGTTTWKVDGLYSPVRDVTFRGTWSEAVRAPNIAELFNPRSGTFAFIDDPCDPSNLDEGAAIREANCLAVLQGLGLTAEEIANFSPATDPEQSTSQPGLVGGNPNLREETARTWTAGVILRPRFLPGFSAAIDWYDIRLEDAVNTATVSELAALCVDQPSLDNVFCEAITRDPETGFISTFVLGPQNVAEFETAGLDVTLNYRFEPALGWGTFNFNLKGGYLDKLTFIATPGADVNDDRGEIGAPKYVANADLTWTKDNWTLNYGLSWTSKVNRFTFEQIRGNPDIAAPEFLRIKERWEHDIFASVDVDDRFTFYGGVNNLFDQKPEVATFSGLPVSPLGRFFYFGARVGLDRLPRLF